MLTAAVLAIALAAAAGARAASRELSQRLVPAAAAAGTLLKEYQAQQTSLRDYVSSGQPAALVPYQEAARQIPAQQARLGRLVRGYRGLPAQLTAAAAAQRSWFVHVSAPQLADMARGRAARARAMQADIPLIRPYVIAVRTRVATLQSMITSQQAAVTERLIGSQKLLVSALIGMCALVVVIAGGGVAVVRRWLLRPFTALRQAVESVAAGDYGSPIPAQGPEEFTNLARSTERMRTRLVFALTERERAEEGFRRLFESAPDATLAVAADGTIALANSQAEHLFGYPPGELAGQPADAVVPVGRRTADGSHLPPDFTGPVPGPRGSSRDLTAKRRDGSEFPVEMSLNSLTFDGQELVTVTIRDITERLAAQAERERLLAEAEQARMQRQLQQAQKLESLGQLVGGVAHDFNNLLNIISGYTNLTAEQLQSPAQHDPQVAGALADLAHVSEAADQASRLTRQLLTFARHDTFHPEVLDLNGIVAGSGKLLRRTLGEHIELTINADPGLWPVKADRGQLEQVLVNLAINARDAMPRGGALSIDTSNVEADATYVAARPGLHPGRYVRMRVSDTGTGMDQATIERAFEPFFTTKPKGRGTGLGLATVYGIVTQSGGTIHIYSEPELGTSVSVLLPATSDAVPARPVIPAPAGAQARGSGETILLAEDEESLRLLARRILTNHGYQVHEALTGPAAVEYAADPANPLDLLLTDVVMPDMLGTGVAEGVHRHRPGLPVLYMSGYAQPILDTHGATGPGMNILEKPFTTPGLLSRVHHALHPTADLPG